MPSFEFDLSYLQAGLGELEEYLLADELFWPLSAPPPVGQTSFPRLTIGGLLLAQARINAWARSAGQRAQAGQLDRELDNVRERWRTAWGQKAAREFTSRMRQWHNYLQDYRKNPDGNAPYFAQEVRLRVMIDLLREGAEWEPSDEEEQLASMDRLLRAGFQTGAFIWDSSIEPGFPPERYWYLRGFLRG